MLLSGLDASHSYALKYALVDMNGNYSAPSITLITSTQGSEDEAVPQVVQRVVLEKTATTARLKVVTNELLRKMKVQYRIVGTDEWIEQSTISTKDNFETLLTGLQMGSVYEYRYVLEDLSGNQLITDWTNL